MGKANKAARRAANAISAIAANSNMLVGMPGKPVTKATYNAWVNAHGGATVVTVKPLPNVVRVNGTAGINAVPFGYGGKPTGVRALLHGYILNGVKGSYNLHTILQACKGHNSGHSTKNPTCILGLLNGGYSPSASTWGTPYIALVAQAPKVAKPKPVAIAKPATATAGTASQPVTVAAIPQPAPSAPATGNGSGTAGNSNT